MRRQRASRFGPALLGSALLHAAVLALLWATATRAESLPTMRVYAVDLVSPPPQVAGEPDPGQAAPLAPEPEPEPEPEPPQPEPEPEPAPTPPQREAPRRETPRQTEPSPPAPTTKKPEPAAPPRTPPKTAAEPSTGPPRPAAGDRPDPGSAGGEDLNIRQQGAEFVDPAYLENIQRQLYRRFRPPSGSTTAAAEVFFRINRNGAVADIRVVSSTGSARFRLAALEAVEQAGLDRAFGPLPDAYPADQLPISFYFRPNR